jgi:hypothetical protein
MIYYLILPTSAVSARIQDKNKLIELIFTKNTFEFSKEKLI